MRANLAGTGRRRGLSLVPAEASPTRPPWDFPSLPRPAWWSYLET